MILDPEKKREYDRAWRAKNRDRLRKLAQKWRDSNRERVRANHLRWTRENRERHLEYGRKWRAKHPRRRYSHVLKNQYGITLDQLTAMIAGQGNACAICRKDFSSLPRRHIHVDHNHRSGAVRGILCSNCNTMIGHAHDSQEILSLGIAYLNVHEASN